MFHKYCTMSLQLTSKQQDAVEHFQGPGLVVAGPGSGKTLVITKRVEYLIDEKGIDPEKIMVTTFTEKAANELRVRLSTLIGPKAARIQISTIHSLCHKLLQDYFTEHNIGLDFDVLDNNAQQFLIHTNKFSLGIFLNRGGGYGWLKKDKLGRDKVGGYQRFYNLLSRNDIAPGELRTELEDRGLLTDDNKRVIHSYEKYLQMLENGNKIDFANLQLKFYKLICENEEILQDIQNRYEFILVDEYQDTSPIQDRIFRMLAPPQNNIFVVGDRNQSIYGFRGATARNFKNFTDHYPEAETYFLDANFRSTQHIVELSNELLDGMIEEVMEARREKEGERSILLEGDTADEMARRTVDLIVEMKEKGVIKKYGDVALLFRCWHHADDYIVHLEEEDIPYVTFGGGGFLDREEVSTMVYLLSYVTQKLHLGSSFKQKWRWWDVSAFKTEVLGFSDHTKRALENLDARIHLFDFKSEEALKAAGFQNQKDIEKIEQLNQLREEVEASPESFSLLDIFYRILDHTGYLNRLLAEDTPASEEKISNLAHLSELISLHEGKPTKIDDLLWFLYSSAGDLEEKKIENENTVKIMSVHKAKGLEFPVVFLCSLTEGRFPRSFRCDECLIPIPEEFYLCPEEKQQKEEEYYLEEKKLFYVGLTRAQDNLIFTTCSKIRVKTQKKSRFLAEIEPYLTKKRDLELPIEKEYKAVEEIPTLNYSAINTYIDCPFRYKLVYEYGFVTPPSFMQNLGVFIHNMLQRIHNDIKNGHRLEDEDIEAYVDEYWTPVYHQKRKDRKMKKKYLDQIIEYYHQVREFYSDI